MKLIGKRFFQFLATLAATKMAQAAKRIAASIENDPK
jgi:hypothetical protein